MRRVAPRAAMRVQTAETKAGSGGVVTVSAVGTSRRARPVSVLTPRGAFLVSAVVLPPTVLGLDEAVTCSTAPSSGRWARIGARTPYATRMQKPRELLEDRSFESRPALATRRTLIAFDHEREGLHGSRGHHSADVRVARLRRHRRVRRPRRSEEHTSELQSPKE